MDSAARGGSAPPEEVRPPWRNPTAALHRDPQDSYLQASMYSEFWVLVDGAALDWFTGQAIQQVGDRVVGAEPVDHLGAEMIGDGGAG